MTDLSGGPILFLNPEVLLPRLSATVTAAGLVYGLRNAPPQTNGSAERLNELCRTIGAAVVVTRLAGMGDVRWRLDRIGFRAAMPADWCTDPAILDTALSIPAWLALHGNPTHAIVDRPAAGPALAIRINVQVGAEVAAGDAAAAALALQALA